MKIFTNGCFDLIHRGHLELFDYCRHRAGSSDESIPASMKGEVIVGLNSDTSIKRLKGEDRPVNTQADRKYLLECLRSVDRVVIFEEDTPEKLIKKINPDLIIKGGDWGKDEVAEIVNADPDKIVIWKYIKGVSTTNTISTIKSC